MFAADLVESVLWTKVVILPEASVQGGDSVIRGVLVRHEEGDGRCGRSH